MKKGGGYAGGSTIFHGGSNWFGRDKVGVDPEFGETTEERRKRKVREARREIAKGRHNEKENQNKDLLKRLNFSGGGPKKTECQNRKDALLRQQLLENYVRDEGEQQRKKEERTARMERVVFEVRKKKIPSKATKSRRRGVRRSTND